MLTNANQVGLAHKAFTREQGGEAHCQVNNLALPNEVMFDWLDEGFEAAFSYPGGGQGING